MRERCGATWIVELDRFAGERMILLLRVRSCRWAFRDFNYLSCS